MPALAIYREAGGEKVFLEGGWKLTDDNLAAIATEKFEPSLPIIIER